MLVFGLKETSLFSDPFFWRLNYYHHFTKEWFSVGTSETWYWSNQIHTKKSTNRPKLQKWVEAGINLTKKGGLIC